MDARVKQLARVNDFVVKFANVNGSGSASANGLFARAILRMGVPVSPRNTFPAHIQGLPTGSEGAGSESGRPGAGARGAPGRGSNPYGGRKARPGQPVAIGGMPSRIVTGNRQFGKPCTFACFRDSKAKKNPSGKEGFGGAQIAVDVQSAGRVLRTRGT